MTAQQPVVDARLIFTQIDQGDFDAAKASLDALPSFHSYRELAEAELAIASGDSPRGRLEAVLAVHRAQRESYGTVRTLSALAALDRVDRRIEDAVRRLTEARDIAAALGDSPDLTANVLIELAITQVDARRPRNAVDTARDAVLAAREAQDPSLEACASVAAALALIEVDDHDTAQSLLEHELRRASDRQDHVSGVGLLCMKGKLLMLRDQSGDAIDALYAAVDAARMSGNRPLETQALTFLLEALEGAEKGTPGRIERVFQCLRERPSEAIRRTPANELVFSGDVLPPWTTAKRALEKFILENALRQTRNNRAAAGRMIKITKVAVHHACMRHGFGGAR